MRLIKSVYRVLRDGCILLIKILLYFIPKDNTLVLLSAWFGEKYSDNTRYMYEYLLNTKEFTAVWYTRNKHVLKQLQDKSMPVVYAKSIKGIWLLIRAKFLLSTIQLNDFNQFFLCNCIYIDLDHGISFKQAGYDIDKSNKYIERHENLVKLMTKYYVTASSYINSQMVKHSYHVDQRQIIFCGKPRDDIFFDESLKKGNEFVEKIKNGRKAILYMPTHRNCGRTKIDCENILDLITIDHLCEQNGWVFIIKKHFYHRNEKTNLDKYQNIYDITDIGWFTLRF